MMKKDRLGEKKRLLKYEKIKNINKKNGLKNNINEGL
jgi:cell division protein FtsL